MPECDVTHFFKEHDHRVDLTSNNQLSNNKCQWTSSKWCAMSLCQTLSLKMKYYSNVGKHDGPSKEHP